MPLRNAKLEQGSRNEFLRAFKTKTLFTRCNLHFHHTRKRLLDPDGYCIKYLIDSLSIAGLFKDDSPEEINKITWEQNQGKEEKTIIVIEEV